MIPMIPNNCIFFQIHFFFIIIEPGIYSIARAREDYIKVRKNVI